jgi:SHS2 domain-containing protein
LWREVRRLAEREAQAGYRLIEHTADAGVVAWGPDLQTAFRQALRGMFTIVLGGDPASLLAGAPTEALVVETGGADRSALLVNWLARFVFHFDVDGFVPIRVDFAECEPPRCQATVTGVHLSDPELAGGVGIKAVTYHQLEVNVAPGRAEVRVIFDI